MCLWIVIERFLVESYETGQVKGCLPVWRDCRATHYDKACGTGYHSQETGGHRTQGRREMGRGGVT